MRIALIGGSGFIGSVLARGLRDAGHTLVNLDLRPPRDPALFERAIVGDLRHPAAVAAALRGCEAVFNLAAAHHDQGIETATYFAVNEAGMQTVCTVMAEFGINRLCFYSSVAVYGESDEACAEDSPTNASSPYGASKLAGEKVCQAWVAQQPDRRLLVIRPTVVFGPGNTANMYALIRQVASRRYVQVGAGTNVKSICYVDNLVAATLYAWSQPSNEAARTFNYVDKPDLSSAQIVGTICQALRQPAPRWRIPLSLALLAAKPFDWYTRITGRNLTISSMRIRKFAASETVYAAGLIRERGFQPPVALGDGIARMCEWFQRTGSRQRPDPSLPPAQPASEFMVLESGSAAPSA